MGTVRGGQSNQRFGVFSTVRRNGFPNGTRIRHAVVYGQGSVGVAGASLLLDLLDSRIGTSLLRNIRSTASE
jgi:hypothetical protein